VKLAGREYESLLRRLRRQAPLRYPVRVVRRIDPDHPDDDDGGCDADPSSGGS